MYLPNPGEFLSYIKYADLVLTDSFHGTCFSIIYNKEFIDILPGVTGTRITSLLKVFSLNDRLVKDYNDVSILQKRINYSDVNSKLKKEQSDSMKKLTKVIEKCGVKYEK